MQISGLRKLANNARQIGSCRHGWKTGFGDQGAPAVGGAAQDSPPEERLRRFVKSLLSQFLSDTDLISQRLGRLVSHEFIEPSSEQCRAIFERHCRPSHAMLLQILGALLPRADASTVSRCAAIIVGQCLLTGFAGSSMSVLDPGLAVLDGLRLHLARLFGGPRFSAFELDLFGRVRSLKAQALEQYLSTEASAKSVELSLVAEVGQAYMSLAADRKHLTLAREILETESASYEVVSDRFRNGVSNELELAQAQTTVDTARVSVAVYEAQVTEDENTLSLLVGLPLGPELAPAKTLAEIAPLATVPAGLPSEVLARRPDVIAAEHTPQGRQRQHRRGQGHVLPDHQPHRQLRHREQRDQRPVQERLPVLDLPPPGDAADLPRRGHPRRGHPRRGQVRRGRPRDHRGPI
jgi:hypothetical protein